MNRKIREAIADLEAACMVKGFLQVEALRLDPTYEPPPADELPDGLAAAEDLIRERRAMLLKLLGR